MSEATGKMVEVILKRSPIATTPKQRRNLHGLGLMHRHQAVVHPDSKTVRGMIRKVIHLVEVRRPKAVSGKIESAAQGTFVEVIPSKGAVKAASKTKGTVAKKRTSAKKEKKST